jgi:hypothetical protein
MSFLSTDPLKATKGYTPEPNPERAFTRIMAAMKRFVFPICLGLLAAFLAIEIAMLMLKHFGPIKDSIFRYD